MMTDDRPLTEQEKEDEAYWLEVARLENLAPQDHDEQAFIDAYLGNQDRRGDR